MIDIAQMNAPLIVVVLVALVLLLPARCDPTIRFKEWLNRDRRR